MTEEEKKILQRLKDHNFTTLVDIEEMLEHCFKIVNDEEQGRVNPEIIKAFVKFWTTV